MSYHKRNVVIRETYPQSHTDNGNMRNRNSFLPNLDSSGLTQEAAEGFCS